MHLKWSGRGTRLEFGITDRQTQLHHLELPCSVFFVFGEPRSSVFAEHEENVAGFQNFGPANPTSPFCASPLRSFVFGEPRFSVFAKHEEDKAGKFETVKLGSPVRNFVLQLHFVRVQRDPFVSVCQTRRKHSRRKCSRSLWFSHRKTNFQFDLRADEALPKNCGHSGAEKRQKRRKAP